MNPKNKPKVSEDERNDDRSTADENVATKETTVCTEPSAVNGSEPDELQKVTDERDEYLDLLKRSQAEFQNYQKRIQKDRQQEREYLIGAVIAEFLPVLDNLERAVAASKEAGESGSLIQGVGLVQSQFLDLLEKNGVRLIESEGQTFDPSWHEAIAQQPSADHPPNTVLHVVETGYKIHDRILRPAKVVVSTEPKGD